MTNHVRYESNLQPGWLDPIKVIRSCSEAQIKVLDHTATRYVIEADRPIEPNLIAMFELTEIDE